ncbi:MAG: integrase arm-type DNA-binding domain-containing protein [Proteobacteria bacterium]|nr:integrase arm-type DNA-binding domain-containing protein [Pseudomonadota bacterium]
MRRKLTALNVGKLPKPPAGQVEYADKDLPGFSLRVTSRGGRSFVLHYRPRAGSHKGKLTRWTLGRLASNPAVANGTDLLSLAQAREIARGARIQIRDQGADPARDGKITEAENDPETYGKAVESYIEKYQIGKKRNRTAGEVKRLLLKEGAEWLERPLAEITRANVHDVLDTLIAANTPYLANRTFAALRTFFRWCAGRDKIERSPCEGMERPFDKEQPRERCYSDKEIKAIWKAADKLGGSRGAFLKVILLSGKRRGEVAGMARVELDLKAKDGPLWTLPADRRKRRTKNDRPVPVPLAALTARILKGQPNLKDNPLVFPGRRKGRPMNGWSVFQRDVQKESKIGDFSFHACRHTLKTQLGELGIPPHVKDRVMDHAPPHSAGEGYDHYDYLSEQREALEAWAGHVKSVVWPKGVEQLHG